MSDAAGLDPRSHADDPPKLVACIRDFLASGLEPRTIEATGIFSLYNDFHVALPAIMAKAQLTLADDEPLTAFNDW